MGSGGQGAAPGVGDLRIGLEKFLPEKITGKIVKLILRRGEPRIRRCGTTGPFQGIRGRNLLISAIRRTRRKLAAI